MKKHDEEGLGDRTYSDVEGKFRDWHENRPPPAPRRWSFDSPEPLLSESTARLVFTGIGVGLGLLLLLLAALSFWTASFWFGIGRGGAGVGWALTGIFLVVAGLGASIGSWNHNFRVANRTPETHH
ncbi:MAG: hypothetical protein M3409_06740 [Gemmatimonadota bacterium]|nr:hypothetical protein [Gemmatimonadota bacterium]